MAVEVLAKSNDNQEWIVTTTQEADAGTLMLGFLKHKVPLSAAVPAIILEPASQDAITSLKNLLKAVAECQFRISLTFNLSKYKESVNELLSLIKNSKCTLRKFKGILVDQDETKILADIISKQTHEAPILEITTSDPGNHHMGQFQRRKHHLVITIDLDTCASVDYKRPLPKTATTLPTLLIYNSDEEQKPALKNLVKALAPRDFKYGAVELHRTQLLDPSLHDLSDALAKSGIIIFCEKYKDVIHTATPGVNTGGRGGGRVAKWKILGSPARKKCCPQKGCVAVDGLLCVSLRTVP